MRMHHVCTLFILLLIPFISEAQQRSKKENSQTTKFGLILQNYTGTTNNSFALGGPGYAFELSIDSGGNYLRYFLKGRVNYSEGKQNFINTDKTTFLSTYKFSAFSPEIGISLYPVSRRTSGINLYLWGVGIVSYNYLDLGTTPANSSLKSRGQGFGSGYGGGLGFELIIPGGRGSGGRQLIYGEVGFRNERAQLVESTQFEISGMTFCLGLGF